MNLLNRPRQFGRFPEVLSNKMFWAACAGGAWVLIDPYIAVQFTLAGVDWSFKIGGVPFSAELKGAVVTIGILGTIAALHAWLPSRDAVRPAPKPEPPPEPKPEGATQ